MLSALRYVTVLAPKQSSPEMQQSSKPASTYAETNGRHTVKEITHLSQRRTGNCLFLSKTVNLLQFAMIFISNIQPARLYFSHVGVWMLLRFPKLPSFSTKVPENA